MEFFFSMEVSSLVFPVLWDIQSVSSFLFEEKIKNSKLNDINLSLRYIPIIMEGERLKKYPSRSSVNKKKNIILSAPQLKIDIFINFPHENMMIEYFSGIDFFFPGMIKLEIDLNFIEDFRRICEEIFFISSNKEEFNAVLRKINERRDALIPVP